MFGENFDMNQLLAQAQQMQQQMQAQAAKTFQGTSGGGLVSVEITGDGQLKGLTISPQACDPDDTEGLADLIIAAFRQAKDSVDASTQAALGQMPHLGL